MSETKEMCPCGFPQSYPIPHEHDQTMREKAIIKHFRDSHDALVKALEEAIDIVEGHPKQSPFVAVEDWKAAIAEAKE